SDIPFHGTHANCAYVACLNTQQLFGHRVHINVAPAIHPVGLNLDAELAAGIEEITLSNDQTITPTSQNVRRLLQLLWTDTAAAGQKRVYGAQGCGRYRISQGPPPGGWAQFHRSRLQLERTRCVPTFHEEPGSTNDVDEADHVGGV